MRDPISHKLGGSLRKARIKKGLTMEELAEKTGLSTNYIGSVERGEKSPTVKILVRIAKALGSTGAALIKGL